jgi:hypothetical protein
MKRARSEAGSGSVNQRYGSVDPDPYRNVTDPEHCQNERVMTENGISYSPLKNINRVDEIKKEAKDITGGAYLLAVARVQAVEQNNQV